MAKIIDLFTYTDDRGNLTVIEKVIPFDIKRIFYIYGVNNTIRGGHRHNTTLQTAIRLQGSCCIYSHDERRKESFLLDNPSKCLILNPEDWHTMNQFTENVILMVLASKHFDSNDYIFTPYQNAI